MVIHARSIFKSIQQGLLICDHKGKIAYFNDAYGAFIGKSLEEVRGMPIKLIRPGSIVTQILRSGKKRENVYRKEGEQEYYVNIYPVFEGNKVTGSVSVVTTIDKERLIKARKKTTLQNRVREFERQQIEELLFLYGYDMEGKKKAARELGISLATLYNKL